MNDIKISQSTSNGIIFYSNKCSQIGTLAYIDDFGEIKTKRVFTRICEMEDFIRTPHKFVTICKKDFIILFDLLLVLVCAIVGYFTLNFNFFIAAIYFSFVISFDFFKLLNTTLNMKYTTYKGLSSSRFHAAEHMGINAYLDLQRVPTLDEIKKYSRFSKKCGSRFILSGVSMYTTISILMSLVPYIELIPYFIILSALTILYIIDSKFGILRFLQFFVTNKPTDKELLVAIEGLKQYEITEQKMLEDQKAVIKGIADDYCSYFSDFSELIDNIEKE